MQADARQLPHYRLQGLDARFRGAVVDYDDRQAAFDERGQHGADLTLMLVVRNDGAGTHCR
jgi:hypothetical protein